MCATTHRLFIKVREAQYEHCNLSFVSKLVGGFRVKIIIKSKDRRQLVCKTHHINPHIARIQANHTKKKTVIDLFSELGFIANYLYKADQFVNGILEKITIGMSLPTCYVTVEI